MSRWRDQDAEEGKRSIALSLSNAVFSKLIKLGRDHGKTPQRMAQELFEDAYARQGSGKAKLAAQVAIAGEPGEMDRLYREANGLQSELEELRAKHRMAVSAYDAAAKDSINLAEELKRREAVIAGNARQLLDQAAEIRNLHGELDVAKEVTVRLGEALNEAKATAAELSRKCWNAEAERDKLRAEAAELREAAKGQLVIVNQASEILKREAEKPQPAEILPPSTEESRLKMAGLQRMLTGLRAAGNSVRDISRETGLSEKAVRQALGPLPAP